jgi:hypothetical protein
MASCKDAASLLLLELDLAWVLTLDRGCAFSLLTFRVFFLLLIGEGSKGDQLYGGGTGRPKCGVSCLGSLCCFFSLTLQSWLCVLRAIRMSYSTVFQSCSHFEHSEEGGCVGAARQAARLAWRLLFYIYPRPGLGAAAGAEAIFAFATHYKSIFGTDYPLRPRAL